MNRNNAQKIRNLNKIFTFLFFSVFLLIILAACNSHKKYSDFDISYSRSGGYAPVYENFLIKGNKAYYSYNGEGKKLSKDFTISADELEKIQQVLAANRFRHIREDHKKVYDRVAITIHVKTGPNSASKTDASFIQPEDQQQWDNVVKVFQEILDFKLNKGVSR